MPSTITAYYSFSPNTKAKSSEVNANFSNYRGSLLPIDPNTATAISNVYGLGTSEYYWTEARIGSLYLSGSTGGWNILPTSTGFLQFNIGGTRVQRFSYSSTYGGLVFSDPINFVGATYFDANPILSSNRSIEFEQTTNNVSIKATLNTLYIGMSAGNAQITSYGVFSEARALGMTTSSNGGVSNYGYAIKSGQLHTSGNVAPGALAGSTVTTGFGTRPIMFCITQNFATIAAGSFILSNGVNVRYNGNTITTINHGSGSILGTTMIWRSSGATTTANFDLVIAGTATSMQNVAFYVMEL